MPWVDYVAHNVTCKCGHKGRLILSSDEFRLSLARARSAEMTAV